MSEIKTDRLASQIVVVASCNVDLISYVERMPKLGETLKGKKFQMGFGGKGANKAIASSRLGSKCSVIAKLGDDVFGKDYLNNFKQNSIDISHVKVTDQAATGVAPIYVDQNGDNSILVILGANLLLSSDDINSCEDLIKNSKILVTNLEIPAQTALTSLKLARKHNVTNILNFAPAELDADDGGVGELLENTDYLILNEIEVEQLSKIKVNDSADALKASKLLLNKYKISNGVIVTLGENGVLYVDRLNCLPHHITVDKVNVVDTSGAGDAFVGAFAHYLCYYGKDSIEKALKLASDYASLSVQKLGTQSSYPRLDEIDAKFKI